MHTHHSRTLAILASIALLAGCSGAGATASDAGVVDAAASPPGATDPSPADPVEEPAETPPTDDGAELDAGLSADGAAPIAKDAGGGGSGGGGGGNKDGGGGGTKDGGVPCPGGGTVETEDNGTAAQANAVPIGVICGALQTKADVDVYTFTLPATAKRVDFEFNGSITLTISADGVSTTITPGNFASPPFKPGKAYTLEASSFKGSAVAYQITATMK